MEPRCDYVPMWSRSGRRCGKEALVRILHSVSGDGEPVVRDRCLGHAGLGRAAYVVLAYRDPGGAWQPSGLTP